MANNSPFQGGYFGLDNFRPRSRVGMIGPNRPNLIDIGRHMHRTRSTSGRIGRLRSFFVCGNLEDAVRRPDLRRVLWCLRIGHVDATMPKFKGGSALAMMATLQDLFRSSQRQFEHKLGDTCTRGRFPTTARICSRYLSELGKPPGVFTRAVCYSCFFEGRARTTSQHVRCFRNTSITSQNPNTRLTPAWMYTRLAWQSPNDSRRPTKPLGELCGHIRPHEHVSHSLLSGCRCPSSIYYAG